MNMKQTRILCATTSLCNGGVQTFLINYAKYLAKYNIYLDFVVQTSEKQVHDDEVMDFGSRIFSVTPYCKSKIHYIKDFASILKEHNEYRIVWMHLNFGNIWPLFASLFARIPYRICHSHSNFKPSSHIVSLYRLFLKKFFRIFATHLWSCSTSSAIWLYGTSKRTMIIRNAVESEKYRFSLDARNRIRETFGIDENEFVWLNVGNLNYAKNQKFLIDVFNCFHKVHPCSSLFICGEGELRQDLEKQIEKLGLLDAVQLVGKVQNPADYMSASDIFVLTSVFEGLPFVAIEAQASSLPCFFSKVVPKEAIFSGTTMSIYDYDVNKWVAKINKTVSCCNHREAICMCNTGYDLSQEAIKLKNIFNKMV